ncbi:hypothetical protein PFISCL1PPCAC_20234, partial [Pristionchus fissidentatus]
MRGEVREAGLPEDLQDGLSAEKQQEQLLMNKLAATGKLPARAASSFLQKKLQQRKFFDSGDYAMDKDRAKQTDPSKPHPLGSDVITAVGGGGGAAAPVAVVAISAAAAAAPVAVSPEPTETNDDGLTIPRPDNVPQRKASIINPNVGCKLSPQPHVHHDIHEE